MQGHAQGLSFHMGHRPQTDETIDRPLPEEYIRAQSGAITKKWALQHDGARIRQLKQPLHFFVKFGAPALVDVLTQSR